VLTAIECASNALRLRMPSSNNVETMFVQHYLEKVSHRSGNVAIIATSRQWCRKSSYKTTNQVGNDAASHPIRRRIKSAMMPQARLVWSHTATRSSIIPQKCGSGNVATIMIKTAVTPQVVLSDDDSSRPSMPQVVLRGYDSSQQWCRKIRRTDVRNK
jgi:hypothetical protein